MITFSQTQDLPLSEQAQKAAKAVAHNHHNQLYPFFDILNDEAHYAQAHDLATTLKKTFKTFVILGTGGSSLGAKTLCDLVQNPFAPIIHFLNNVDPQTITGLLDTLDLASTAFIAVSKSGSTAETLMQTLCLMSVLETKGLDITKHLHVITEDKASPLHDLALSYGITPLSHHKGIGGRFSVFSNVGLLPALLAGIDCTALIKSAKAYLDSFIKNPTDHHATKGSHRAYQALTSEGRNISVMMPYKDQLRSFADWYGQLWAESLGKESQGSTPVTALGTVDQHSQLQLYRDGPDDKVYTLLIPETKDGGIDFTPHEYALQNPDLAYMTNKSMSDLLCAEAKATADSLTNANRPVRIISFPSLDTETMGALLMHFMLETIVTAEILGINAFDQPGVEESKVLTRTYMSATPSI